MTKLLLSCLLLLAGFGLSTSALAAECTEITLPGYTINAGGRYCLGANLQVSGTSGNVIAITADDVELDCRGYTIRNSATSVNGSANAISVSNHRNVRVRNCQIEGGFAAGIFAYQDNGQANLNRNMAFTGNTISGAYWYGIFAYGTDIEIRDNLIYNIGGHGSFAMGIRVGGSQLAGQPRSFMVRDNVIRDVVSPVNYGYGIYANNADASSFVGNTITGTTGADTWFDYGIKVALGAKNKLTGNQISGGRSGYDVGISSPAADACYDNHIRADYSTTFCDSSLGNY